MYTYIVNIHMYIYIYIYMYIHTLCVCMKRLVLFCGARPGPAKTCSIVTLLGVGCGARITCALPPAEASKRVASFAAP